MVFETERGFGHKGHKVLHKEHKAFLKVLTLWPSCILRDLSVPKLLQHKKTPYTQRFVQSTKLF